MAATSKAEEMSVSAESDVVAHHSRIHPYQFHREGVDDEFHLDLNCTAARKVAVHPLIAAPGEAFSTVWYVERIAQTALSINEPM